MKPTRIVLWQLSTRINGKDPLLQDIKIVRAYLKSHRIEILDYYNDRICIQTARGNVQIYPVVHIPQACTPPTITDPEYITKLKEYIQTCKTHSCDQCPLLPNQ